MILLAFGLAKVVSRKPEEQFQKDVKKTKNKVSKLSRIRFPIPSIGINSIMAIIGVLVASVIFIPIFSSISSTFTCTPQISGNSTMHVVCEQVKNSIDMLLLLLSIAVIIAAFVMIRGILI